MKPVWWAQIKAVIRLEIRKTFFAKRGLWIYLLAAMPILLFGAHAIGTATHRKYTAMLARKSTKPLTEQDLLAVTKGMTQEEVVALLGPPPVQSQRDELPPHGSSPNVISRHYEYTDGQNDLYIWIRDGKVTGTFFRRGFDLGVDAIVYAGVFQFFFLRLAVFFGCLGIFMNLFRGEVLDRSLHFYFLAPVRREVLMAGKFLAGLLATCTIFLVSEVLQQVAFLWHYTPALRDVYLFHNHGLENAGTYLGVTLLACVGYGAFFLVAGMLFRNPIIPAAIILIWEGINPFLPSVLKHVSVIYYLRSLCPVDIPTPPGMPALIALLVSNADPVSRPAAIVGILIVTLLALYVSTLQVRRMEINYTTE